MPELEQTVCQTCGDKGFSEAMVICVKCHDAWEHRYCSPEWPKNFEDNVDWTCSDCVLPNAEQSMSGNPFCRHRNNVEMSDSSFEIALRDTCVVSQKEIQIGEIIDALQPHQVHPEADLVKRSPLVKNKRTSCCNMNLDEFQKSVHEEMPTSKDESCLGVEVGIGATSQARTYDTSTTFEAYDVLRAKPFSEPTWRGGFSICSDFCTAMGLVSHLSTRASIKVFEAAQQFPSVLHLNLYHRLQIWPKSFSRSEPTDAQIGLYFLPETERDECVYKSLVDRMVDEELALMAVIDNLELLVFTSLQLPKECWRLMGNYYLWGVLKKCSPLST